MTWLHTNGCNAIVNVSPVMLALQSRPRCQSSESGDDAFMMVRPSFWLLHRTLDSYLIRAWASAALWRTPVKFKGLERWLNCNDVLQRHRHFFCVVRLLFSTLLSWWFWMETITCFSFVLFSVEISFSLIIWRKQWVRIFFIWDPKSVYDSCLQVDLDWWWQSTYFL